MKRYEKYKKVDLPWLKEVPEHWEISKIKNIVETIGSGATPSSSKNDYYANGTNNWIQSGDLYRTDYVKATKKKITDLAIKDNSALKKYHKEFIVIAMYGASVGNIAISKIDAFTNQACCSLKPNNKINIEYLFFGMKTLQNYMISNAKGGTQPNISRSFLEQIKMIIPPKSEQEKIAAFLDYKISRIDKAIELEEKKKEEIKNLKQSIISDAVTKGLDPDVPMKDSGVDWIGEIPEHWEVSKVKHLYNIMLGKMISSSKSDEQQRFGNYLCSANIKWKGVNVEIQKKMWFTSREEEKLRLKYGDILISEGGDAGVACIYRNEFEPCYIQNSVLRCNSNYNNNVFLYYWIQRLYNLNYMDFACSKATIKHYTKEKVERTPIVAIPLQEQENIVSYLDKKTSEIDTYLSKIDQKIEKLKSLKQSLISEVVTGQIDVRDFEIPKEVE